MNPSLLTQAIDRSFPKLDDDLRKEIYKRVSEHLFEVLKDKVENDSRLLQNFHQAVKNELDDKKQVELYAKTILKKLASLPIDKQKSIRQEIAREFNRVIKEIYTTYE